MKSIINILKSKKGKKAKRAFLASLTTRQIFSIILFNVKLSFTNLSPAKQVLKARDIVTSMTGNPHFPTPSPALADVTIAADALQLAENAMDGSRAKTIARNLRKKELELLMGLLQDYVQFASGRNPEIILSSGMEVKNPNTKVGFLPATEWIKGKNLAMLGSILLNWKPVAKAVDYRIEGTTDLSLGFPMVFQATKASLRINDLEPGVKYYFRIATTNAAGYDAYSATFSIRVNLPQD